MTAARAACPLLLALFLGPGSAASDATETIGGHDEAWWREGSAGRAGAVAACEEALASCEETEAPPAYDGIEGYVVLRRRGPEFVRIKRCDDERAALDDARDALERFEEQARKLDVPPGWLR